MFGPLLDVELWIIVILHLAKCQQAVKGSWQLQKRWQVWDVSRGFGLHCTALHYTPLHFATPHDNYSYKCNCGYARLQLRYTTHYTTPRHTYTYNYAYNNNNYYYYYSYYCYSC